MSVSGITRSLRLKVKRTLHEKSKVESNEVEIRHAEARILMLEMDSWTRRRNYLLCQSGEIDQHKCLELIAGLNQVK